MGTVRVSSRRRLRSGVWATALWLRQCLAWGVTRFSRSSRAQPTQVLQYVINSRDLMTFWIFQGYGAYKEPTSEESRGIEDAAFARIATFVTN